MKMFKGWEGAAILAVFLFAALSCASIPQKVMDEFNAAKARADRVRAASLAVQANVYFPDQWKGADADYDTAKKSDTSAKAGVIAATGLYTNAADVWESITRESTPRFAEDMDKAEAVWRESKERADQARQNAEDSQAPVYIAEDWEAVDGTYRQAGSSSKKTPAEIEAASNMYLVAANQFDELAARTATLIAQERKDAETALQEAMARADKSRAAAQAVQASNYFADEWKEAETAYQTGKDTPKDTIANINSATEQYTAAADAYDELTGKSQPLFARDEAARKAAAEKAAAEAKKALEDAQKALATATARADKSRAAAMEVDGQTYFANDWRAAEGKLQAARSARKTTADEVKAATAQFNGAADSYDSITGKARPMFARDKDAATKALQAAVTRAQQSRTAATNANGQANMPAEWKNAEAKNQSASSAKRGTTAEMNSAVTLYNAAADAYDDITKRSATTREAAADAVAKAKAKAAESVDYATSTGREMEGNNE